MVGSEGTLAFVSEVELETIPNPPLKSTGLIIFPSIQLACESINDFNNCGVISLELMDYASLKTGVYLDDCPYNINILGKNSAALLCEFQEYDHNNLLAKERKLESLSKQYKGKLVSNFEQDEIKRLKLWKIRKKSIYNYRFTQETRYERNHRRSLFRCK